MKQDKSEKDYVREAARVGARGVVEGLVAVHSMAKMRARNGRKKLAIEGASLTDLVETGRAVLAMHDPLETARERAHTAERNHQQLDTKYRAVRLAADRTSEALRHALDGNARLVEPLLRADRQDTLVRLLRDERDEALAALTRAEQKVRALNEMVSVEDAERPPVAMSAAEPPFWRAMKNRHGSVDLSESESTTIRKSLRSGLNELMHAATRVEVGADGSMRFTLPAGWAVRDMLDNMSKALGDIGASVRKATKATKGLVGALKR
jgi:hypothetical protein